MIAHLWFKIFITVSAIVVGLGLQYYRPGTKPDNPIEEVAEYVIDQETGIDVDLTPNSPEKK